MIRSNVRYNFVFAQPDDKSVYEAGRTLRLPVEGHDFLVAMKPGRCIYLAAPSDIPFPILLQVDFIPPSREPRHEDFDMHPVVNGRRLHQIPELKAAMDRLMPPTGGAKQANDQAQSLSRQAQRLLQVKVAWPWHPVARLWEKIGDIPNPEIQDKVRKELEGHYAKFVMPRLGSRSQLLMWPTLEGWRYAKADPPKRLTRGGDKHQHYTHWVGMTGEAQGVKVFLEWIVPGTTHPVDCAWVFDDGTFRVFEVIVTATTNIGSHIDACFNQSTAVSELVIVVEQKKLAKQWERKLKVDPAITPFLDRIRVDVITNYMEVLK